MSNILQPPPLIERFQYKKCKQINDPVTKKRLYLTPDGEKLPSVTTILSHTKDMTALNAWRRRMGDARAAAITREASAVGTAMHANLERYLLSEQRQPGNNPVHVKANAMAEVIINNGLSHMDEVWAMEQSLYFPGLYSGTTDLVGVFNGEPAIADHKQTNKPKKEEWIEDYLIQLAAYATAHNEVYGTDIKRGVIFMCSRGDDTVKVGGEVYQQFDLTPDNFNKYQELWLNKVEEYYTSELYGMKQLPTG